MTDIVDNKTRSRMMSNIKGKNTRPEMLVRRFLFGIGFRYRLHQKNLPGKPDIVLSRYRTAIFIHGCFWHRHAGCSLAYLPKSNTEKWNRKFSSNIERDRQVIRRLSDEGWHVIVIWECGIRKKVHEGLCWLPDAIRSDAAGEVTCWPMNNAKPRQSGN